MPVPASNNFLLFLINLNLSHRLSHYLFNLNSQTALRMFKKLYFFTTYFEFLKGFNQLILL